jgi:coenzyme F420-reducing hydrogenase alpha subunit
MPNNLEIKIHHLTRVEGHGDIFAAVREGRAVEAGFAIAEAPRFFEAILQGQSFAEVVHIASRICGICAVSHRCAALKATENAMGVSVSEQTRRLRHLAFHGEIIGSHILHVYFLALPDFLEIPSIFPLAKTRPGFFKRAMRLKKLGYDLSAAVLGRHIHPVAMTVGGFSRLHAERDLARMREKLVRGLEDIQETVRFFRNLAVPDFERETRYISLKHPEKYAFYDGDLYAGDGEYLNPDRYREIIAEYVVPHSTAKHARWRKAPYMVGALARLNNNYRQLKPVARQLARELGLAAPCFNPFRITTAQIVECAHCMQESIELIDRILETGLHAGSSQASFRVRAGRGIGAVEAPRGTLFHEYAYDERGICRSANHVIPTAQNLANLEADMQACAAAMTDRGKAPIANKLAMLVRAYDPCISCATH